MKRVVALSIFFVLAPLPTSAAEQTVPDAVTLVENVLKAHASLGPTTITCMQFLRQPDGPDVTMRNITQWNDKNHFVSKTTGNLNDYYSIGVANGTSRIFYTSVDNAFSRNDNRAKYVNPLIQPQLDLLSKGLASKDARLALATAKVTLAMSGKEPVYRFYMGSDRGEGSRYVAFLAGRKDFLVRKYVTYQNESENTTTTVTYKKEAQPFPSNTFVFTPPQDAMDITGRS